MTKGLKNNKALAILMAFALLLTSLTVLAPAAPVQAAGGIHYVREGAGGDGSSWADALGSLPAALVRGDTYYIADGSYTGYTCNTSEEGTATITIKKATVADHGASIGWEDTYGDGQAQFNGMIEFTTSYWVFDGQTGGGAGQWNSGFGFKIYEPGDRNNMIRVAAAGTANHITVKHVEFQGKGSVSTEGGGYSNDALAIYDAHDVTLSYYWMHDIGRAPLFISAQDVIFEYGYIESYYGSPSVHSEVASIWSFDGLVGDMSFRYNLVTDIKSTGGLMWDNSANPDAHFYVYGNIFYKPAGANWDRANGVIGGWTGNGGEEFHNCIVYNNTFVNIDQECLSTFPRIASGNVAYNNLFYNCSTVNFSKFDTHDYNQFINSGDAYAEPNGMIAYGNSPFRNSTGFDFRLVGATAAGLVLAAPYNMDLMDNIRGSDSIWDRGAMESDITTPLPTTPPIPRATLTVIPEIVSPGQTVTVTFNNVASPTVSDWIGMFAADSDDGSGSDWTALDWLYTSSGTQGYGSEPNASGTFSFTVPDEAGTYNFRLFENDGFTRLAVSNPVTVISGPKPVLTVSPELAAPGETVTVSFSNVSDPTVSDWIGMFAEDAEDGSGTNWTALDWLYTSSGTQGFGSEAKESGSFVFKLPDEAGKYNFRLFEEDGFKKLAVSNTVKVVKVPVCDMIFSSGSISLAGNAKIAGNAGTNSDAGSVAIKGAAEIEGNLNTALARTYVLPKFPTVPELSQKGDLDVAALYTLDSSGSFGTVTVTDKLIVNVGTEDVILAADTLKVYGEGSITVNRTGTGKLILFIAKQLEMTDSGSINGLGSNNDMVLCYEGDKPLSFHGRTSFTGSMFTRVSSFEATGSSVIKGIIVSGGSAVTLSGNSALDAGVFYAPKAVVTLSGSSKIYGATVAKSLQLSGNARMILSGTVNRDFLKLLEWENIE